MNALTLSAIRRRDQVVILTGPAIGARSAKSFRKRAKIIINRIFSLRVSVIVAVVCAAAVWVHVITIDDALAAQAAVARDCLCALPWGIAGALRTLRSPVQEEGGGL